jgi:hypothetical protein
MGDTTQHICCCSRRPFKDREQRYLDKGAGLFQTLDALTPEAASDVPCAGGQTIAAHCAHLAYYIRVNHSYAIGWEQHVDWASSWRPQQVGDRDAAYSRRTLALSVSHGSRTA